MVWLMVHSAWAGTCVPEVFHFLPLLEEEVPLDARALTDFDACGRDVNVMLNNELLYVISDDSPDIIRLALPGMQPGSPQIVQLLTADDGFPLLGRGSTWFTSGTTAAAPPGTPTVSDVLVLREIVDGASEQYSYRVMWDLRPSPDQDQLTVMDVEIALDTTVMIPFGTSLEVAPWSAVNRGDVTVETLGEAPAAQACVRAFEQNAAGTDGTVVEVCVDVPPVDDPTGTTPTNPTDPTTPAGDDDDASGDAPAEEGGCGCASPGSIPTAGLLAMVGLLGVRRRTG